MQAIQERESIRIIAPSRSNLKASVAEGRFRPDLYYRISVAPLSLPPLRERKADLPELSQFLLERLGERHKRSGFHILPSAHSRFQRCEWPGNVRELENVIERMLVLSADGELREEDLPPEMQSQVGPIRESLIPTAEAGLSLEKVEHDLLLCALRKFRGNQTRAAQYLNISRRTLIYRMHKHHLSGYEERS